MRKIYNHMNVDQKKTAIKLFKEDLEELKKEQKQESEKGYPLFLVNVHMIVNFSHGKSPFLTNFKQKL